MFGYAKNRYAKQRKRRESGRLLEKPLVFPVPLKNDLSISSLPMKRHNFKLMNEYRISTQIPDRDKEKSLEAAAGLPEWVRRCACWKPKVSSCRVSGLRKIQNAKIRSKKRQKPKFYTQ